MSTAQSPVELYRQHRIDPRPRRDPEAPERECEVRVVLRKDDSRARVMVEIEDEQKDALGYISWVRLDCSRSSDTTRSLEDLRGAYDVVEGIVHTMFERLQVTEKKLLASEEKVRHLESRMHAAPLLKPKPPLVQPDPLASVKAKVSALLMLATNEAVGNSERNAAVKQAQEIVAKYNLLAVK